MNQGSIAHLFVGHSKGPVRLLGSNVKRVCHLHWGGCVEFCSCLCWAGFWLGVQIHTQQHAILVQNHNNTTTTTTTLTTTKDPCFSSSPQSSFLPTQTLEISLALNKVPANSDYTATHGKPKTQNKTKYMHSTHSIPSQLYSTDIGIFDYKLLTPHIEHFRKQFF